MTLEHQGISIRKKERDLLQTQTAASWWRSAVAVCLKRRMQVERIRECTRPEDRA